MLWILLQERIKAAEEHKRNIMEYRAFLESCDFIKALLNLIIVVESIILHKCILILFYPCTLGKQPVEKSPRPSGG